MLGMHRKIRFAVAAAFIAALVALPSRGQVIDECTKSCGADSLACVKECLEKEGPNGDRKALNACAERCPTASIKPCIDGCRSKRQRK
jgi:hypothetical protein